MKFVAVSYCQPDLDGEILSREALQKLEHNTPVPFMLDFRETIGTVEESKVIGDVLISFGEFEAVNIRPAIFEKHFGVGIGYMCDSESKEIIKITGVSLTVCPTCPQTRVIFLRDKYA